MKNEINDQSKNDIQELLVEYIVTPVNNAISQRTDGLRENSEELAKALEKFKGSLEAGFASVTKCLKELEEASETTGEELSDTIAGTVEEVEKLKKNLSAISESLKENNDSLIKKVGISEQDVLEMLAGMDSKLKGYHDTSRLELSRLKTEMEIDIKDKYKVLLYTSILLGALNSLGIVAMLLLKLFF